MTERTQPDAPLRLIGKERVAQLIDGTESHVDYLRRNDPCFPTPVKLGAAFNSAVRFVEAEVLAWLAARVAARDTDAERVRAQGARMAARLNAQLPPGARRGGRKSKAASTAAAAQNAGSTR